MPTSWIIIPVAGLLSLIPYLIVRARGWRKVPGNSLGLLFLNWWSAVTVACTIPGKLTGGGSDSVLELLTSESMSRAWNDRILITALVFGAVSWMALVLASVVAGGARSPSRLQTRTGLVVAIAVPCIVMIAGMLGGTVENSRTDGAGELPEFALERTLDEQLGLLAQREELTQASLSEVRHLIAADGWTSVHPWMFRSCEGEANPCYDIYAAAQIAQADADRAIDTRFIDELREAGWRSAGKLPYCHSSNIESFQNEEGQRLCVNHGDGNISVALIAPSYWGNLFELREAADSGALIFDPAARDQSATYRWDEWQSSILGQS